jgi:hypothetical protein
MTEAAHVRFRWILPIVELIICGILLWPFRYGYEFQFRGALHDLFPKLVPTEESVINFPAPDDPANDDGRYAELRLAAPSLINIPVGFMGLARRETVPAAFLPEWWRAITWPLAGIIFWWISGRGIEALLASRRGLLTPTISWVEAVIGLLVSVGTAALLIGLTVDPSVRSDSIFPWRLEVLACSLWFVLGLVSTSARLVQWRMRRRLAAHPEGETARA